MMQDKLEEIIARCEAQLEQNSKLFNNLGFAKLAGVIALVVCTTFLFAGGFAFWVAAVTAIVFTVMVLLWVRHYRLDNKIRYTKGIIAIGKRHVARITGGWVNFEDIGTEFVDFSHYYACDLDIVGTKSLFQFLNTTHTWHGRQAFAKDLLYPNYTITELSERQEAIAELSNEVNFSNDMEYFLSQVGATPLAAELAAELANPVPLKLTPHDLKWDIAIKFSICYIPVPTLLLLILGAIFQVRPVFLAGIMFLFAQVILCFAARKPVYKYLGIMDRLPYKLEKYVKVIDIIIGREFSSAGLNRIKSQLAVASEAVTALEKIGNKLSIRSNPLVYLALNAFLLWDLHCALLLERWKAKYSHQAGEWFLVIGEFESLLSFSHLPKVCDNVCLPTICEEGRVLDAKDLGHPLLSNSSRVCNNLSLDNSIFIISGSNMSGKTTFMRTVGVNLLLARAGSFVCASQMTCTRFDIATSMRIADDLSEGVSTFYAELKRVRLILDLAQENPNLIFLIDEIFKGTNSVDRLAGADAVITKLVELEAVGMISTHDLELCKLADLHGRVRNFSFSEEYKVERSEPQLLSSECLCLPQGGLCPTERNGIKREIYFDYKIRIGQSKTTNARFLMEMIGIT